MKGDFSRDTFDAAKHYSAVLMQQGRVQLDADWNEQQALNQYRDETEATDVIGPCGGPKGSAGFAITTDGTNLFIGAGRYYVDGILCQNEAEKLPYDGQGDLPGASMSSVIEAFKELNTTSGLVYLDVWKRHVTFLEDGLILEKALGEPDTATRLQTVWQVRVLPVRSGADNERLAELLGRRSDAQAEIKRADEAAAVLARPILAVQKRLEALPADSNERPQLERRLEELLDQQTQARKASKAAGTELAKVERAIAELAPSGKLGCDDAPDEWADLPRLSTGTLTARASAPDAQESPCLPPPGTGYRRLENQLYRVEVHEPGPLGTATMKWSRDNGTVVTGIELISGNTIVVDDLGRDEMLGFKAGDWVEITDDALELTGRPGQLAQINPPNEATGQITLLNATPTPLANNPEGLDRARHPKLRRWDQVTQQAAPADEHGIGTSATFVPLEDGVEVQFGPGNYQTGDYWLIPARTAIGDIEWPPFAVPNVSPEPAPARGVEHHYCRLATLELGDGEMKVTDDCRSIFCPLTEVDCADETALHVTATSWRNDDLLRPEDDGTFELRMTVDLAPDPDSIHDASVIVTAEVPYQQRDGDTSGAFQSVIIDGEVGIDSDDKRVIVWRYRPQPSIRPGSGAHPLGTDSTVLAASRSRSLPRLTVTLKGPVIWSPQRGGERRYLDGQAFGVPEQRPESRIPRTALTFPTGTGAKASDFESWFYLNQGQRTIESLRVTTVTFRDANERSGSAGTLEFPRPEPTTVSFESAEMRVIDITFNRPTVTIDQPPPSGQSVVVERIVRGAPLRRIFGTVRQVDDTTVRYIADDPPNFGRGSYVLNVLGEDDDRAGAPAVRAADDESRLDGDFDGNEGADFVLPFQAL